MMVFRSILSVVVGFVAMVVVVTIGAALATTATHATASAPPTSLYLALNLALSPLAGVVGGWMCRRLAPVNPSRFGWVLVFLVVALGLVGTLRPAPGQLAWYGGVITLLGALGVALGGRVWKRS